MAKKRKLKRKVVNWILNGLMIICLIIAVYSGWHVVSALLDYQKSNSAYQDLKKHAITRPDTTVQAVDTGASDEVDFSYLEQLNPDVAGWISLPNSSIDYPFVFGASQDASRHGNEYYLKHLLTGEYSNSGCVFMDVRNGADFTKKNVVLYGHHMKNGSMFADVEKYASQEFYDEHQVFYIDTPQGKYEMYPVAGMRTVGTNDYVRFDFTSDQDYLDYVQGFIDQSTFQSNYQIEASDQMMMLSTCSYKVEDGRYVVIGKLVKV